MAEDKLLHAPLSDSQERRKRGRCVFIPESHFRFRGERGRGGRKFIFFVIRANPVSELFDKFFEFYDSHKVPTVS